MKYNNKLTNFSNAQSFKIIKIIKDRKKLNILKFLDFGAHISGGIIIVVL